MLGSYKSELLKLTTIRSTYVVTAIGLFFVAVACFWVEGYKGISGSPASELTPSALTEIVGQGAGIGALFTMIIAILFTAHEYRYNTIQYTLTSNVHRTKVLLIKVTSVILFTLILGLIFTLTGIALYYFGLSLRDASLPAQEIDILTTFARLAFYFTGYTLLGTLIAVATRSVIAAISTMFLFPAMIEPLLGLLLKENSKYLPFMALDSVAGTSIASTPLTTNEAVLVSCAYLLVGLLFTWILFTKRDAS